MGEGKWRQLCWRPFRQVPLWDGPQEGELCRISSTEGATQGVSVQGISIPRRATSHLTQGDPAVLLTGDMQAVQSCAWLLHRLGRSGCVSQCEPPWTWRLGCPQAVRGTKLRGASWAQEGEEGSAKSSIFPSCPCLVPGLGPSLPAWHRRCSRASQGPRYRLQLLLGSG